MGVLVTYDSDLYIWLVTDCHAAPGFEYIFVLLKLSTKNKYISDNLIAESKDAIQRMTIQVLSWEKYLPNIDKIQWNKMNWLKRAYSEKSFNELDAFFSRAIFIVINTVSIIIGKQSY